VTLWRVPGAARSSPNDGDTTIFLTV
jgi:hypothetical protein